MVKHFLTILDLKPKELNWILERSKFYKKGKAKKFLKGKSVAMIFEKASTRTRLSFEVGIYQLGGQPIFMSTNSMQIAREEPIKDTARVLSRYVDAIIIRAYSHKEVEELARFSTVPVINALTDLYHPCQIVSDLFTLKERGIDIEKMKLAFVGDANNVANSWINASALLGFEFRIASPNGYKPKNDIIKLASQKGRTNLKIYDSPAEAVNGVDVVYTDVWVSMGQEGEEKVRRKVFKDYQVSSELLRNAKKDVLVLHCLPAHRGEEITEEVMNDYAEIIFEQAENRLHTQKAILELVIKGEDV